MDSALQGGGLGEAGEAVLGGDIGGFEGRGDLGMGRAHIDDAAPFFDFMWGRARRVVWKAADRFSAMMRFHLSTGNSSMGATNCVPALFTRMSMPPKVQAASAIMASMASGFVRSAPVKAAFTL